MLPMISDRTATMTQTASRSDHPFQSLVGATGKLDALVRLAFAMALPFFILGLMACLVSATGGSHSLLLESPSSKAVEYGIAFLVELCAGIATSAIFRRQPSRIAAAALLEHVTMVTVLVAVTHPSMADWLFYSLAGSGLVVGATLVERLPAISRSRWNEAARLTARLAVAATVVTILLANAAAHYLPLRPERISHQLCDDIHKGDDFAPIVEKARVIGMNHRSHANYNEFWVNGWAGSYAACEIWTEDGKVGYKVASTTGMRNMGLILDASSQYNLAPKAGSFTATE
jgi:preprotein translocase subunit SecG